MNEIPNRFYRVSIKALILNETRDKFLINLESDGHWELPGGGLDWGEDYRDCLSREITEEMGLTTIWVAEHPSYFLTGESTNKPIIPIVNVIFEARVEHLEITPTDECQDIQFVNKDDLDGLNVYEGVTKLAAMFDPDRNQ